MNSIQKSTYLIPILLLVGFTVWLILSYMVNVPNADDYGLYLGFINGLETPDPFMKKLNHFFSQQNEHRPFIPRLICFLQYAIFGKVNFVALMMVGNLFWFISIRIIQKKYQIKIISLPMIILLILFLNLIHWENLFWATGALQNFGVICFSLASFYFCTQNNRHQYLAVLFAILAFYTSGNGLFAMLTTSSYVIFHGRYAVKVFTVIIVSLMVILYFRNFTSNPLLHSPIENLTQRPGMVIDYFLVYFSGPLFFTGIHTKWILQLMGGLIIIISIAGLYKTIRKDWFSFSVIVFCLLSGLSAAFSRGELGHLQALTPRYQTINVVLFFILGMVFLKQVKLNFIPSTLVITAATIVYFLTFNQNKTYMLEYHHKLRKTAQCHLKTNPTNVYVYPIPAIAWIILIQSEEFGTYKLPPMKSNYNCSEPTM